MKKLTSLRLAVRLPVFLIFFCIATAAALVVASVMAFQKAALAEAEGHLGALAHERKIAVEQWLGNVESDILMIAAYPSTAASMKRLDAGWRSLGPDAKAVLQNGYVKENPNEEADRHLLNRAEGRESYHIRHGLYHPSFRLTREEKGYADLLLINMEGELIYSVSKGNDYATNLLTGEFSDSGLSQVFTAASEGEVGTTYFSGFAPYPASGGRISSFVSTQIVDERGRTLGILAIELPTALMTEVLTNPSGLGESGEVYLVSRDGFAQSAARNDGGHAFLERLAESPQIEAGLANEPQAFEDAIGLMGQSVIAQATPAKFNGVTWALIAEKDIAEILSPVRAMRNQLLLIGSICVAVLTLVGWAFGRTITQPLKRVSDTMRKVSDGDLDAEVLDATRYDEIGDIAKVLESFKERLAGARHAEAERKALQDEQSRVVTALSEGLVQLSAGNLTAPLEEPFAEDYDKLRMDYNRTLTVLNGLIVDVVSASDSIKQGAGEISQASDDLSNRTENQAATLEQTAAALDELTSSVKSAADGAKSVEEIVGGARQEAEKSGTIVRNAVSAMTEIEKSSDHISQIIGVIDDIAFQTNLLALNAGVEAARAGDAGKGFAVVASEVRALAQRSSEAAKEIKELIDGSTVQVERGVELVGKAGEALESIVSQVTHISTLISDIAVGSAEQSTGLGEINTGVTQLDQVTQQNAAMVEQSTAASHMLNKDATRLSQLVATFRVSSDAAVETVDIAEVPPSPHGAELGDEKDFSVLPIAVNGAGPAQAADQQVGVWQDF